MGSKWCQSKLDGVQVGSGGATNFGAFLGAKSSERSLTHDQRVKRLRGHRMSSLTPLNMLDVATPLI